MMRQVEKLGKGSTYNVGNMCWQIQSFHFVKNQIVWDERKKRKFFAGGVFCYAKSSCHYESVLKGERNRLYLDGKAYAQVREYACLMWDNVKVKAASSVYGWCRFAV